MQKVLREIQKSLSESQHKMVIKCNILLAHNLGLPIFSELFYRYSPSFIFPLIPCLSQLNASRLKRRDTLKLGDKNIQFSTYLYIFRLSHSAMQGPYTLHGAGDVKTDFNDPTLTPATPPHHPKTTKTTKNKTKKNIYISCFTMGKPETQFHLATIQVSKHLTIA